MSTEYHQEPSQHAFFTASSQPDMDPWILSAAANSMSVDWAKGTRHMVQSLPMFDDDGPWSSPAVSPTSFGSSLKQAISPPPFLSLNTAPDLWSPTPTPTDSEDENEDSADGDSVDDSSSGGDGADGGPPLYKTELCRSFIETGTCRYGLKCQFAHGHNELRHLNRHPKYKTEICKTFHTLGTCPYGTRCRFIHTAGGGRRSAPASMRTSPSTSPYSSPPLSSHHLSRSSSPPTAASAFMPKWTASWPQNAPAKREPDSVMEEEEPAPALVAASSSPSSPIEIREGDGVNESTVPEDSNAPSKKRLAIFRTISKDQLWE